MFRWKFVFECFITVYLSFVSVYDFEGIISNFLVLIFLYLLFYKKTLVSLTKSNSKWEILPTWPNPHLPENLNMGGGRTFSPLQNASNNFNPNYSLSRFYILVILIHTNLHWFCIDELWFLHTKEREDAIDHLMHLVTSLYQGVYQRFILGRAFMICRCDKFLCSFYVMLPCFCKHEKSGFACYQIFSLFAIFCLVSG